MLGGMGKRFTLVEMMIVIGIVAVLAAIAIPAVVEMQYKAKSAELDVNLSGIREAAVAYHAAYDAWPITNLSPRALGSLDKTKVAWNGATWNGIWAPDGDVRGTYQMRDTPLFACGFAYFYYWGAIDVDDAGYNKEKYCCVDRQYTHFGLSGNMDGLCQERWPGVNY